MISKRLVYRLNVPIIYFWNVNESFLIGRKHAAKPADNPRQYKILMIERNSAKSVSYD